MSGPGRSGPDSDDPLVFQVAVHRDGDEGVRRSANAGLPIGSPTTAQQPSMLCEKHRVVEAADKRRDGYGVKGSHASEGRLQELSVTEPTLAQGR